MKEALIGYTAGVFDLFNVGHLNLLRHARERCEMLIVGVTTDELAEQTKGRLPVVPFLERLSIVQSVRYVESAVPQTTMDKFAAWDVLKFDVLFAGENVRGRADWKVTEQTMADAGVAVVYLPTTRAPSGALLERHPDDPGRGLT